MKPKKKYVHDYVIRRCRLAPGAAMGVTPKRRPPTELHNFASNTVNKKLLICEYCDLRLRFQHRHPKPQNQARMNEMISAI